ncbi:hypothetical protein H6P81_017758 [Aristolochia fimbriata]|uniref:B3 domain-containing transcription repressor VAL2 n=1 Tax=Aristolochia fimbriata TaxID=158543 RepID=A0AAV7DZJ0_ARIFI|nr:hypothetical protein H6P81_017758 [Aristolochia fimbriata]
MAPPNRVGDRRFRTFSRPRPFRPPFSVTEPHDLTDIGSSVFGFPRFPIRRSTLQVRQQVHRPPTAAASAVKSRFPDVSPTHPTAQLDPGWGPRRTRCGGQTSAERSGAEPWRKSARSRRRLSPLLWTSAPSLRPHLDIANAVRRPVANSTVFSRLKGDGAAWEGARVGEMSGTARGGWVRWDVFLGSNWKMAARVCMNPSCGTRAPTEWKKGWGLRSGGLACLCDKCGSAFEQLVFCDTFHLDESGWRECSSCGKRLHCGCIASKTSIELLDSGGVECLSCARNSDYSSIPGYACQDSALESNSRVLKLPHKSPKDDKPSGATSDNVGEQQSSSADTKLDDTVAEVNNSQGTIKREHIVLPLGDIGTTNFPGAKPLSGGSSQAVKRNDAKESEALANTCLNITLGTSNPNLPLPISNIAVEGKEMNKLMAPLQQGQRSRHLLPKPPKGGPNSGLEISKDVVSQIRVARPPGEGRGRNQLLPRYWPRITDQELQQISGDSNSTIVPLFEKVLSASDAGRIGRLVLPKACAEAYFPPISQPEGLPLKIQDAKGKDWVFQFRFWPNNNSRMYVLEGVTPCIQSMQLQAGDTVTFSRLEPEGKLVMGFRKASNSLAMQDTQIPAVASNGVQSKESFMSGVIENLPIISGYSGLLQSLKGSADPHLNALSEHLNSAEGDINWLRPEKHGGRPIEGFPFQPSMPVIERRRSRNIGSKSKRLVIDTEDALELKLTWEEAQELLRPPPSVKPSVVMIDDHEFEEYEEPPVFGKRTIFTARASGAQDQWAQCDSCYKWRRLPLDVLIQSKWICADNVWDSTRSSCSAPDEISPKELENLVRMNVEFKRRKTVGTQKLALDQEPHSGLDALASAAVLGDDGNSTPPLTGPTTKHPRHRPGCMCIVCIQPPSGKGPKHKPTCTCNVCMTVKRRFKTLMMRKKKRQMEKEAENANKRQVWVKDEGDEDSFLRRDDSESVQSRILLEKAELGKVGIDLNCQPDRDEDASSGRVSMVSLLQVATRPLETYLKQNGLTSLISETPVSSSSLVLPQVTVESEGRDPDDDCFPAAVKEREGVGDATIEQTPSDPV